jgi:glycosyltransferase involved in cell wall biosynthesis
LPDKESVKHEPVALVIPAYNEGLRIGDLLGTLCQVGMLSRIIVVDDGSTDGTAAVVQASARTDPRIQLLRIADNRGKAAAMVAGAEASGCDLIAFIDADLIQLRPEHVIDLIEPVRTGTCSMTLGLFTGGRWTTDNSHRLSPFLSGQRCLRWSLFRGIPDLDTSRAGIEIALSLYAWRHGYRVCPVHWRGVTHVMKIEKMGMLRGNLSHFKMYGEILRYLLHSLTADRREPRLSKPRWAGGSRED